MKRLFTISIVAAAALASALAHEKALVRTEHLANSDTSPAFRFRNANPVKGDAAEKGTFRILSGERDPNGGTLSVLNDGKLPAQEDHPAANFFFQARTDGGRVLLDLGRPVEVEQVNTFSWHPSGRGPQVYKLHGASEGSAIPKGSRAGELPEGWVLLGAVDTRSEADSAGGQYAVSITTAKGTIGTFRYLLFEMAQTDRDDPFSNTFYSEIDVIEAGSVGEPIRQEIAEALIEFSDDSGKYEFTIEASTTPDLVPWIRKELVPTVKEWYPKLVKMLPSDGYEAPRRVRIVFDGDMRGVANASGSRIRCAGEWFRRNLDGEAKGAVVHELVHVVQQYGWGRRNNPEATRTPGWIVEGIPDYIRWFLYEPESKGAEITERNFERARYDANYRITGNFLNWVVQKHGPELIRELNAAAREGRYAETFWKEHTGKAVEELGDQWREEARARLGK